MNITNKYFMLFFLTIIATLGMEKILEEYVNTTISWVALVLISIIGLSYVVTKKRRGK